MKNIYLFLLAFLIPSAFLIGQTKVYPPELSLPENGAIDQMPNVQLDWKAVAGETFEILYEVQLSEDTMFTNPVTFPLVEVTALKASELNFGQKYFWRVRAYDGDNISDWSVVWSFTVLNVVDIKSPTDGLEVSPQVNIEWEAIDGASSYQLLVDTLFIWKRERMPFTNSIRSVIVLNEDVYGGVGDDGLIFHWENGQLIIDESGTTKDLLDIAFVGEGGNGWVVGKSGTVLHLTENGWESVDIGTNKDLYGISFADEDNGWIVGKNGKVFYYNGTGWSEENAGVSENLYDVWALSANDVWMVGKSGTFVHYDGSNYTVSTPGTKDYQSLWFNSANDGWAVAKSARYAHWDGTTWTEYDLGISKTLYGVAFKDENEGYIVGQSGNLFKYEGNGNWKKVTSGTTNDIYAIDFTDGTGVYAGKKGDFYTYNGEGFNSPFAQIFNIGGENSSYSLNNLLFATTYYYKMRAAHSADTSDWCDARSFKVQSFPVLLSPSNGATDQQLKVELDWKDFPGVLKYNISIADNPDFNNAFNSSTDSSFYLVTGLTFGQEYYWRVNGQHATATSPWSNAWTFTTVNSVNLVSPPNGATNVDPCPMVKWESIEGALSYEVWLDTTESFLTPMIRVETGDFSQCQQQLKKGKTYYWRVRAIVALDTSDFSQVWSFTTKSPDGIEEDYLNSSLSVYPNPSNGLFNIDFVALKHSSIVVNVVDVLGKVVYQQTLEVNQGENNIKVNLDNVSSGTYNLLIKGENISVTRKITIK